MRNNNRLVKELTIAPLITVGGVGIINNNSSNVINTNGANSEIVQAATTTSSITLPKGYTAKRILAVNNNKISAKNKKALINASIQGMKTNTFHGDENEKNEMVDVLHLTYNQKVEINRYALNLINSARVQLHKKPWVLNKSAMNFADKVAAEYHNNGKSVWDADHYVAGITRAAVASWS